LHGSVTSFIFLCFVFSYADLTRTEINRKIKMTKPARQPQNRVNNKKKKAKVREHTHTREKHAHARERGRRGRGRGPQKNEK
jgi:hypothetical protein